MTSADKREVKMAEVVLSCIICGRRKYSPEEAEQRNRSREIDKIIERDKQHYRRQVKLLLLGAGESGKSTFLKQMRIIHGYDFDDTVIEEYRTVIYQNIVRGMKVLVDARNKLNIPWENARDNATNGSYVMKFDNGIILDTKLFLDYIPVLRSLWQDKGIQSAFERRREYQLGDSIRYFLDNVDRIGTQDYVPTTLDILHARKATKGIAEFGVTIKGVPFLFVDVGGQRSQRQKWFQCFQGVTSILFLVSSSEFDQVILEDRRTNRLQESRAIFETIANNRCFSEVSIILFLNKMDLLEEKLKKKDVNISQYFQDFKGEPHTLKDVQTYLLSMFDESRRDRKKPLFHHFTTAVDTENIKVVFNAVRDTILQNNLKQLMLQ